MHRKTRLLRFGHATFESHRYAALRPGKMFVVGTPLFSCYHLIVKYIRTCCRNSKTASTVIHGARPPMPLELLPRTYSKRRIGPELPEIPSDEWCDFRLEYEQGKTLKQIATDYHCDPRTVRKSLLLNQGSNDIGKQNCSKKITAFVPRINDLYQKYTGTNDSENRFPDTDNKAVGSGNHLPSKEAHIKECGICGISRLITEQITAEGYTGSERTVRNYLSSRFICIRPQTCRKDEHDDNH